MIMSDNLIETIQHASKDLANEKQVAIRKAMKFILGEDWEFEEFAERGRFISQIDGTELFEFDGTPLLHFGHLKTIIRCGDDGPEIEFKQAITKIYDR